MDDFIKEVNSLHEEPEEAAEEEVVHQNGRNEAARPVVLNQIIETY